MVIIPDNKTEKFFFSWFLHAPKVFCFPGFYMRLFSYPSGFVVSLRSRKKFLSFALPSYFFLVLLHPIVYVFVCSIVPPLSWFFKYTLLVQRGILSLSLSDFELIFPVFTGINNCKHQHGVSRQGSWVFVIFNQHIDLHLLYFLGYPWAFFELPSLHHLGLFLGRLCACALVYLGSLHTLRLIPFFQYDRRQALSTLFLITFFFF